MITINIQLTVNVNLDAYIVTHIACARVDISDRHEITVGQPVGEHYDGKEVMGAGAWA
jgi:hypothetical protein